MVCRINLTRKKPHNKRAKKDDPEGTGSESLCKSNQDDYELLPFLPTHASQAHVSSGLTSPRCERHENLSISVLEISDIIGSRVRA